MKISALFCEFHMIDPFRDVDADLVETVAQCVFIRSSVFWYFTGHISICIMVVQIQRAVIII